jgi:short subunit dehydrogenase-like uncharacterized protein
MSQAKYDVIVFGATSFVGQILCRYLVAEFGTLTAPGKRALRWAVAGRSREKLAAVMAELGVANDEIELLVADSSDAPALKKMASRARVVVSTVGPYALYGDQLVEACAEIGTDYCDLTGEAHWVRKMIAAHEAKAKESGARIVHCCGFDSIPSDIGVWHLQQQAIQQFGAPCTEVSMRVKAMRGAASGGTVASMVNVIREATKDRAIRREYANPYSLCIGGEEADGVQQVSRQTSKSSTRAIYTTKQRNVAGPVFDKDVGVWVAPFVMAAINTRVVLRSSRMAGNPYGDAFRYDEAMMMGRGVAGRVRATTFSAGLGAFVAGAAIAPTRWLMEKTMLPAPGTGPSPTAQEKGFWDYRFVGKTADGRTIRTKLTGDRDPGYGSTAKMLGEAAACLALDVPKSTLGGGFWTPATAMAAPLLKRLVNHAGISATVV